jgi:mRNA-degrading endonuclease RelE of RelBE toxin-antitoxin system
MTYHIGHKPAFLVDFVELPRNLQRHIIGAIGDLRECAEEPRGNTIKRLSGYKRLWRYRQGDLRMIYAVAGHFVQLLAVGNRSDIYDRLFGSPDLPIDEDYTTVIEGLLSFEHTGLPPWFERVLENLVESRRSRNKREEPLPRTLTRQDLSRWHVPTKHHDALMSCQTSIDLLRCKVPQDSVERVLEHLYPRPADQVAQQPDLRLVEPEDLIRYAEGDLLGFLLRLDSEQDRYVGWALDGPTLVKGGPGSGKSTIALYRARALVENGAGNVLFTTYTNALVGFSRQLLEQLMGDLPVQIQVSTLDSIAVQIVQGCDQEHLNIGGSNEIKAALNDAQIHFSQSPGANREKRLLSGDVQSLRKDYLVEETEWVIEGRNLQGVDEYLETDRAGRGYGFDERTRRAMWRIYQHVQDFLRKRRIVTWGYVRSRALELVQLSQWAKRWDAVIVDEAQDLTPTALALCVELCRDPGGLFLTADASQSLYNRGFRWKDIHTELQVVGRTRILRKN